MLIDLAQFPVIVHHVMMIFFVLANVAVEDPGNSGPLEADIADDRFPSSREDVVPVTVNNSNARSSVAQCSGAGQKLKKDIHTHLLLANSSCRSSPII